MINLPVRKKGYPHQLLIPGHTLHLDHIGRKAAIQKMATGPLTELTHVPKAVDLMRAHGISRKNLEKAGFSKIALDAAERELAERGGTDEKVAAEREAVPRKRRPEEEAMSAAIHIIAGGRARGAADRALEEQLVDAGLERRTARQLLRTTPGRQR